MNHILMEMMLDEEYRQRKVDRGRDYQSGSSPRNQNHYRKEKADQSKWDWPINLLSWINRKLKALI